MHHSKNPTSLRIYTNSYTKNSFNLFEKLSTAENPPQLNQHWFFTIALVLNAVAIIIILYIGAAYKGGGSKPQLPKPFPDTLLKNDASSKCKK